MRATLATGKSQGQESTSSIQRGVSVFADTSHRPAGAAERAPEALEIRNRNPAEPRAGMIMPVYRARRVRSRTHCIARAAAAFSVLSRISPIAIAAEIADGRPIRHRGRRAHRRRAT